MGEAPRGTLGTIHNAARLLSLLSDGPAHHPLSELAERSELSLATVHRLLRSLVVAGLAEQDPASSHYGLGPELVRLGERYVARLPITKAASPYLVELRDRTGATVVAATTIGEDAHYVDRLEGSDAGGLYRSFTRSQPLGECAAGRVLAAYGSDELWGLAVEHPDVSEEDRALWVEAGHVVMTVKPPAGRIEVAAPVRGADGMVMAAVAVLASSTVGSERVEEEFVPYVRQAAKAISQALGHA